MEGGLSPEDKKLVVGFAALVLGIILLIFATVISIIAFPVSLPVGIITGIIGVASTLVGGTNLTRQLLSDSSNSNDTKSLK